MRSREVLRAVKDRTGTRIRTGKGSHVRVTCPCGAHHTTVPTHKGEDVKPGTLRGIESDLAACQHFGPGWLTKKE